jgi:hypothetical protein
MKRELSGRRLRLLQISTVLISLGFSLFLAEIFLRGRAWYNNNQGLAKSESTKAYEFSPNRHHQLVPNSKYHHKELEFNYLWENNSLGMRDRPRMKETPPNTFRILFLGDSMVQGYGVPLEQSMVYLLENSINQPPRSQKIEILNGGIFGYSPLLEYLYLQEIFPKVKPDLILVGLFLGNDIGDDHFYTESGKWQSNDQVLFTEMTWPWDYMNKVLAEEKSSANKNSTNLNNRHSFSQIIFDKVFMRSQIVREIVQLRKQNRTVEAEKARLKRQEEMVIKYKDNIRVNLGLVNYPVGDRQQRMKYWEKTLSYLTKIHLYCEKQNIPMVLVLIPVLESKINKFNEPYEIAEEFAKKLKIPMIQLLPEMRQHPPETLIFPLDGHWNQTGNQIASKIMDQQLRQLDLLPK